MKRFCMVLLAACVWLSVPVIAQEPIPLATSAHPRLWLTVEQLPTLRAAAHDNSLIWTEIVSIAEELRDRMNADNFADADFGGYSYEEYPAENVALLFAFMAQIHPDEAQRADYAARARDLLLRVIDPAAQGLADAPFRMGDFSISDRSRWYGAGFALTVDWLYETLTAEDKNKIATVFTRWCDENRHAGTTTNNHPEPIGVVNDPVLVADRSYARWANNNYYAAHMRNMGMMALALDAADDTSGALSTCLTEAIGAWLYVIDDQMRTDSAGGFGAEGYEYSPQTYGYVAEFLLALHTAGYDDPVEFGAQATFETPFWDDAISAYVHTLSPRPALNEEFGTLVYQPSWYGSAQVYLMPDHIQMFGPLGYYSALTYNAERVNALRWLQLNTAPGLAEGLADRIDYEQLIHPILYFLLYANSDPASAIDPRPTLPTSHYAPGLRRLLARSDWTEDARVFSYGLPWLLVDHQSAVGNTFEFNRKGEWLTGVRIGYDLDYLSSNNMNALTIENTPQEYDDWRQFFQQQGSQWIYVASGDPQPPVIEQTDSYIAITGDATPLYNSDYVESTDVQRATRQIVWLKPDVIVICDRATTGSAGFKRFNLNLPTTATLSGSTATMNTASGQGLTIMNLFADNSTSSISAWQDEVSDSPANGQLMTFHYVTEANGNPADASFLHVLIGSDAETPLPAITLVNADPNAPVVQIGDTTIAFDGTTIQVGQ